jgi:exodeoxyribonuclease V gamma subunit
MLTIIRSNRVERLLETLADRLAAAPPDSPFQVEQILVPGPAMARWVNLQLARRHGVAANLEYPLTASFVWRLAGALLGGLPEQDPLAREALAWKVFAALPGLVGEPAFEPLRRYLGQDSRGLKRFELAARIADVLDRYQLYRPALIRDWDAGGGDDDWQARLWRQLTAGLAGRHRVAVIDRLLATLHGPPPGDGLPGRVSLFAVSSLPPLLVEVLHALARHVAVTLYLHAPTNAFWADLIPERAMARKRLEHPEEAELWEVGNDLLASWGRQGQALQDLLLERDAPLDERDAFEEPSGGSLLERLQQDIFALSPTPARDARREAAADDSLQVHVCHGPLRECQVLHDRLLAMLETDAGLRPEDILVMVPEISAYAPYVEAVFGRGEAGGRPFIPWNLSDISVQDEHPLVRTFLQLLSLPESRFSQSEVLSYLDVPELAGHFGLGAEAVARVREWLDRANVRWGLDAAHKERLGLPGVAENTWAQAEQRLFGGYALGASALFEGIAPVGGDQGAGAEPLGRFWRLISRLTESAQVLSAARTAGEWQVLLGRLLEDFFGQREDEDGRIQRIRDALADLAEEAAGVGEPLAPELVRRWLAGRLGGESRHGRYFSGGVTVCGMRPMRSLPFRVICVLGLQDQAFPRRDRPTELDRMRRDWRPGDPRKGDEDRYLFLETLLCARRRLYLSYVGRDSRKNTERQPSVLVRELLDYVDQHYRPAGGAQEDTLSERLTRVHPLQPFSPANFAGEGASYDQDWCELANALRAAQASSPQEPAGWPRARLPAPPERMREVTLEQLERFVRHPVRSLVNSRLRVWLGEEEPEEDDERFELDGLQWYLLKRRLVADRLAGLTPSRRGLSAEGLLPHGAFGGLAYEEAAEAAETLLERLEPYLKGRPGQAPVDLAFEDEAGPRRLTGAVGGLYPGLGLLRWTPARLKGPDVLGLWLAHLAWCATGGEGEKRSALHAGDESFLIAEALAAEAARERLAGYLGWYWEGLQQPLPVFPNASFVYARGSLEGRREPMKAARQRWEGNDFQEIPGDRDDAHVRLVLRGLAGDPLAEEAFTGWALAFYGEALRAGGFA